jgi:uncharacterized protein YcfJ
MSRALFVVMLALGLGACSQGSQTQTPAQDKAQTPPASAAPPAAPPDTAASGQPTAAPAAAAPAVEASPQAAPPSASTTAAVERPTASAAAKPDANAPSARSTGAGEPAPPSTPAKTPPPEPEFREVTIPSGTVLAVTLRTSVASDTSRVEDAVHGTLNKALVIGGVTAVPADAEIVGTVRSARQSGRVKGLASVAFQFERVIVRGEPLAIRTATVSRQATSNRRKDVKNGAIGAAAGGIIGGLLGGGKGAAIGAGAGGTGAVVATRGDEVRLAAGTIVRTTLQRPLTVLVPRVKGS